MPEAPDMETRTVDFYFDPACPWTWITSRWAVQLTDHDGVEIRWRPLSLSHLDDGDVPERLRRHHAAGATALRVVQTLRARDDDAAIARFYDAIGTRWFREGGEPAATTVSEIAVAAGLPDDVAAAAGDDTLDEAVAAQTDEAMALAGPEVGSPVIAFGEPRVGFHGPLLDSVPDVDETVRLWRAIVAAANVPALHKLKRGRQGGPDVKNS
ncbi:DsbA family protein [soil metagenome]